MTNFLSYYWYSDETADLLAKECLRQADERLVGRLVVKISKNWILSFSWLFACTRQKIIQSLFLIHVESLDTSDRLAWKMFWHFFVAWFSLPSNLFHQCNANSWFYWEKEISQRHVQFQWGALQCGLHLLAHSVHQAQEASQVPIAHIQIHSVTVSQKGQTTK